MCALCEQYESILNMFTISIKRLFFADTKERRKKTQKMLHKNNRFLPLPHMPIKYLLFYSFLVVFVVVVVIHFGWGSLASATLHSFWSGIYTKWMRFSYIFRYFFHFIQRFLFVFNSTTVWTLNTLNSNNNKQNEKNMYYIRFPNWFFEFFLRDFENIFNFHASQWISPEKQDPIQNKEMLAFQLKLGYIDIQIFKKINKYFECVLFQLLLNQYECEFICFVFLVPTNSNR